MDKLGGHRAEGRYVVSSCRSTRTPAQPHDWMSGLTLAPGLGARPSLGRPPSRRSAGPESPMTARRHALRRQAATVLGLLAMILTLGSLAPTPSFAAAGSLTGNVSNGSGTGLPSTVTIDQQNTTTVVTQGATEANGNFTIPVPDGTYDIVVTPQSSSYVPRTLYGVVVSGSSTSLDVVLALVGSGTLSGTLVDDLGKPVPDVKISLSSPSEPTTTATSESNGAFSMNVANGYYQVELQRTTARMA